MENDDVFVFSLQETQGILVVNRDINTDTYLFIIAGTRVQSELCHNNLLLLTVSHQLQLSPAASFINDLGFLPPAQYDLLTVRENDVRMGVGDTP